MPEAANDEAINGELFIHQPDVDRLMREARRLAKDDPFLAVALLSAGIGMLLHTSPTSGTTAVCGSIASTVIARFATQGAIQNHSGHGDLAAANAKLH